MKPGTFAKSVDFGKTASDYGSHRAGFPDVFFDRLVEQLTLTTGNVALDMGTGTGTIARGLARHGLQVCACDPSQALLDQASRLATEENLRIKFTAGTAEAVDLPDATLDLFIAGQCWHWFDQDKAASEAYRLLKPGGHMVIAYFDWLPISGNVVAATEALILEANPAWLPMAGGHGIHGEYLEGLTRAGFTQLETTSFDVAQPYTHEAWRGRIRASAGIKASLNEEDTQTFDEHLRTLLLDEFSEDPLLIPHRVWWVTGQR